MVIIGFICIRMYDSIGAYSKGRCYYLLGLCLNSIKSLILAVKPTDEQCLYSLLFDLDHHLMFLNALKLND